MSLSEPGQVSPTMETFSTLWFGGAVGIHVAVSVELGVVKPLTKRPAYVSCEQVARPVEAHVSSVVSAYVTVDSVPPVVTARPVPVTATVLAPPVGGATVTLPE